MPANIETFMEAIDRSDVAFLRDYLDRYPELLNTKLKWSDGYEGYALHYAAFRNNLPAIEFLVVEKHADINRQKDVGANWTPLHHAKKANAYAAAALLAELGARTDLVNSDNKTTADFVQSGEVRKWREPGLWARIENLRKEEGERRLAGKWVLTGEKEVMHDYEQPDSRQRLTDTFNFETRIWRATARDLDGKGMVQTIIFFDDMPDRTILEGALAKLKELGGKADEGAIGGGLFAKKSLRLPQPGQV